MITPDLEMLARIIEQLPHAMFVKDRSFRYILVNAALVHVGGHPREAILGKTDYDFLPKDVADFYRDKDLEVFSSADGVNVAEEAITDGTGTRRVLMTRKVPLRDSNGEVTHLVGVLSDITRLKAVEEDLRLSAETLERRVAERTRALAMAQEDLVRKERLAVLGQLAGGVAHQIRNPLGAIKNAAYVLQRRVREDGEVAQAIEIIHDEVQRANHIITGLLDYARVRVPVRKPASVAEIIDRAIAEQTLPANLQITRRVAELPSVALDAEQLEGALFNLLRNAIEAMPAGGTLTIEGERREDAIVVRVLDTGEGISPEAEERLFEPLVTTKPLGLGLGLVTARTLIEGQGGTLRFVRTPSGACFEATLPIE